MSKNPYDPLDGLGSIRDIQEQLGISRQMRWVDDLQDVALRFNREQANLASTLGVTRSARDEIDRLMTQIDATKALGDFRNLTDVMSQARALDSTSLKGIADSISVRELLGTHHLLNGVVPEQLNRIVDTRALAGYAAEQLTSGAALRSAAAAYSVPESARLMAQMADHVRAVLPRHHADEIQRIIGGISSGAALRAAEGVYGISEPSRLAEQLAGQVQAFLPKHYIDQFHGVVGGIDFDAIWSSARAASSRANDVLEESEDSDFDEVYAAVDQAGLDDVRTVVQEALAKAIADAVEKGDVKGDPPELLGLFRSLLIQVLATVIGGILLSIMKPLYEKAPERAPAESAPVAKTAHSITDSPAKKSSSPRHVGDLLLVSVRASSVFLGPDTKQRIIGTVPVGQILRKRRMQRGWVLVVYADPRGDGASITGWVREKYVRSIEAETLRVIMCAFDSRPNEDDCDS